MISNEEIKEIKESKQPTPEDLVVIDNLLEGWMEIYERSIYDGKTLNELIDIN